MEIPERGLSEEEILARLAEMKKNDGDWRGGKTWSLVYYPGEGAYRIAKAAYMEFFAENALNPAVFPSLRQMEQDVVRMGASLLGDPQACGNMTSGGTESLLLAVKTARDWAEAKRRVLEPEMVMPETAHPALLKAARYFKVKPILTPVTSDFRADVDAIADAITDRTVLVVASAPQYPQGVVDPIEEIASVAAEREIPFHVDACLGGYLLPWLKELGYEVPRFDLSVEGVWSLSADLHKYGFAAKGASTVFYKSREYRKYQFFAYAGWSGGLYGTPTMLGARPGGAVAAAWAVLNYLGRSGYLELARTIMETTEALMGAVSGTGKLEILGKPHMSVFAFRSIDPSIDVVEVGAGMHERGWRLDRQQFPDSLHMMVTPAHASAVESFADDLERVVARLAEKAPVGRAGGGSADGARKERAEVGREVGRSASEATTSSVASYGGVVVDTGPDELERREQAILAFLDALT